MGSGANYPLSFPIVAGNPGPLRDIASAAGEISKQLKLSKGELQYFTASVKEGTDKGQSLTKTLSDISRSASTAGPGVANLAGQLKGLTKEYQALEAAKNKAYKSGGSGPGSDMEKEAQRIKAATAAVAAALRLPTADFEKFKSLTNEGLAAGKGLGQVLGEISSAKTLGPGITILASQIQGISKQYDVLQDKQKAQRIAEEAAFTARKTRLKDEAEASGNAAAARLSRLPLPPQRAKDPVVLQLAGLSQNSVLQRLAPQFESIAANAKLSSAEIGTFNVLLSQGVKSGLDFEKALRGIAKAAAGTKVGALAGDLGGVITAEREAAAAAEAAAKAATQRFRENFRSGIYAAQITSHLGPMGGNLAGVGRHGANLLNIFSSPVGLTVTAVTGVVAMGAALLAAAKNAGELAKEQGNAAQRTSLSIKDYSLMAAAAKEAGVAEGSLTTAQRTLSKALSENSAEGKVAKEALQQIGVTATNAMGGFVGGRKFLEDFDQALQKVSGPEKEDLIIKVFGRGGLEMLPLFNGRLKETLGTLQGVGAGFDDLSARSARNFEASLDRMATRWHAFLRDLGTGVAEATGFEDPVKRRIEATKQAEKFGYTDRDRKTLLGLPPGPGQIGGISEIRSPEAQRLHDQIAAEKQLIREYTARIPKIDEKTGAIKVNGEPLSAQDKADLARWKQELPLLREQERAARTGASLPENFTKSDIEAKQLAGYRERIGIIGDTFDQGSKVGRTAQIQNNIQNLEKKVAELRSPGHTPQLAPGENFRQAADRDAKALESYVNQITAQKQLLEVESRRESILKEIEAIQESTAALQDKAKYQRYGRIGELLGERRTMDRGFDKQLADVDREQKENPALRGELDKKREAIRLARKDETAALNAELLKAVFDQADKDRLEKARTEQVLNSYVGKGKQQLRDFQSYFLRKDIGDQLEGFRADDQIEGIQSQTKRERVIRESGQVQRRAKDQFSQPGQEGSAAIASYNAEIGLANELYRIDLERAAKEDDLSKQRVLVATAEADLQRKTADARISAETQILDIRKQQTTEARNLSGQFFDAATSGRPADMFRNIGKQTGKTIFQNATTDIFKSFKMPLAQDPNSGLGKLFQGTMFGADPAKQATEGLSRETAMNTIATRESVAAEKDLANAIRSQVQATEYVTSGGTVGSMPGGVAPPISTSGGLSGIPGLSTFGSDTTGFTGNTGAGSIGALLASLGAIGSGSTAAIRAVFGGNKGGAGGGGGSIGNGASVSYSNVYNPETGKFDVQAPDGTIIPGVGGQPGKLASIVGIAQKGIGTFAGLMANPFGDKGGLPGVNGQPGKDLGHFSAMGVAAAGADVALGAFTAISQFKKGGARGALGGASAILGTAAALDPEPISNAILGIAALGTGLVKSMLGDPKVERQKEISKKLFLDQYEAPQALNVTSSTRGTFADIGRDGNIRQSSLSPYPRVTSSYLDLPYRFNVPGTQASQFGGGGTVIVNNHIQALDGQSFEAFLKKNPTALMEGVSHGLTFGASRATQSLKGVLGQG